MPLLLDLRLKSLPLKTIRQLDALRLSNFCINLIRWN